MSGIIKLIKAFILDGISFRWTKYLLKEYDYFDQMMNLKYAQITIKKDELVTSKIYSDNSLLNIHDDAVDLIKEVYIQHIVDNCSLGNNDCKMKNVPFMTILKSAGFFHMTKTHHFAQGLYAYDGTSVPYDIVNKDYCIIYLDSSKLFPTLDETIDCCDFTKIFLKQPQQTTGLSTAVTQGSNWNNYKWKYWMYNGY